MGHSNLTKSALRKGDSLKDGLAHEQDHSRRNFLRKLGILGSSGFLLNQLPVSAMSMSPLAAALTSGDDERVLVFVRLKGGNDGLNTFIPIHDFGTYQTLRPDIHIPRADAVDLTSTLAIHPQLAAIKPLWEAGQMRVVQNVGYPDHSLSHFRSSDIWASGSGADEYVNSGVLGRYISGQYPDFLTTPPEAPPAIQIGGPGNLLFNNANDFNYAISTRNPTQLYEIARTGQLYDTTAVPECTYGEQLRYVRAVANTTFKYAGVLSRAFDAGSNTAEYENDRLGDQFALVARLLRGGLKTRFFVIEQDGYDTHASQAGDHASLMNSLGNNIKAFYEDLETGGIDERVLSVTFSEFGRRIFQNGSRGTDHGTAAPMMLFGKGLNGNGMTGGLPDLQNVDQGNNLFHTTDFRSVYATIMANWLCIDGNVVDELMGQVFPRIDGLGLSCQGTTSTRTPERAATIGMKAYLNGGQVVVEYDLPANANVNVHFFDMAGRKLSSPFSGRRPAGLQTQHFPLGSVGFAAGIYVLSLEVDGRMYSSRVAMFR
jgi:uncharacterized protein (DUF1501 family)